MRQRRTRKRPCRKYQKRTQSGTSLNRYDFAYADRDTVNQVGKITPGIIKSASLEINNIAQQGINQIISQGEKKSKRCYQTFLEEPSRTFIKHPFVC